MISYLVKPKIKTPDYLLYKFKNPQRPNYNYFHIASVKDGKLKGEISTIVDTNLGGFYPKNNIPEKSLYIGILKSFQRDCGIGTKLINFAKNISRQSGCEGRIHLISSDNYDYFRPPHVFYRKLGFTSTDKRKIQAIDRQIQTGLPKSFKFGGLYMYYSPESKIGECENMIFKKPSIFAKIKDFLSVFFS